MGGLPYLAGVVTAPVLKPDGTISTAPGYDADTGLLHLPDGVKVSVPDDPTQVQAKAAAALLLDLVGDFPFEKSTHRSAWLAFLLTLLSRHAFVGPAPLWLFDSNAPGSGKAVGRDRQPHRHWHGYARQRLRSRRQRAKKGDHSRGFGGRPTHCAR